MQVGVASSSKLAAEAGARIADAGGNAVDCAVAATMASAVCDMGLCSVAASGALTVWPPGGEEPITFVGAVTMPGKGASPDRVGRGMYDAMMRYGGGWPVRVGPGSVGVFGITRACGEAMRRFGNLSWREVLEPACAYARDGFPLSPGVHAFLTDTYEATFGWNRDGIADVVDDDWRLRPIGSRIRIRNLGDTMRSLADNGPEELYTGELGRRIGAWMEQNDGLLTARDLAEYRAVDAAPTRVAAFGWDVASYPPPSVGGATLAAMLRLMAKHGFERWSRADVEHLVDAQNRVLCFRRDNLDESDDLDRDVARLLAEIGAEGRKSPSTVHSSAVDSGGLACSSTASIGYCSGVVPAETGIFMGNPLGEIELNVKPLEERTPGEYLSTNMAPTVARRPNGAVLAIGSPGAGRITTAILQALVGYFGGMSLADAVAHPRAHVELGDHGMRVAYEPGMPVDELEVEGRRFERQDLFFGGVAVAAWDPENGFELAGDPRRACGTAVGGARDRHPNSEHSSPGRAPKS